MYMTYANNDNIIQSASLSPSHQSENGAALNILESSMNETTLDIDIWMNKQWKFPPNSQSTLNIKIYTQSSNDIFSFSFIQNDDIYFTLIIDEDDMNVTQIYGDCVEDKTNQNTDDELNAFIDTNKHNITSLEMNIIHDPINQTTQWIYSSSNTFISCSLNSMLINQTSVIFISGSFRLQRIDLVLSSTQSIGLFIIYFTLLRLRIVTIAHKPYKTESQQISNTIHSNTETTDNTFNSGLQTLLIIVLAFVVFLTILCAVICLKMSAVMRMEMDIDNDEANKHSMAMHIDYNAPNRSSPSQQMLSMDMMANNPLFRGHISSTFRNEGEIRETNIVPDLVGDFDDIVTSFDNVCSEFTLDGMQTAHSYVETNTNTQY